MQWLGGLPPVTMAVGVGVLMALEASVLLGVVVPGDVGLLMAAATVGSTEGVVLVVLAAVVGCLVGETGGYLIGRSLGPRLRSGRLGRIVGQDRWNRTDRYMERRGGVAVSLARYLAAAHALTPLVAGSAHMSYRRFIGWSALGAVSWAALYGFIGSLVGASYRVAADNLGLSSLILMGLVVVGGGIWFLIRRNHPKDPDHLSSDEPIEPPMLDSAR